MGKKVARAAGLTGLAAGLVALAGAAAAPALAATADTGGTFAIGIFKSRVASLARAGIVVLPTGAGTAAVVNSGERITLPVTGGNANFVGTSGTLHLAGGIELIDGATGKSVTLTSLSFSYDTAEIGARAGGRGLGLGVIGGSENGTQDPVGGTPTSQTFTASSISLTAAAAKYLDRVLHTKYFKAQSDLGSLATTYSIETVS
jgi:hypothetical protein